ncbi:DUF302 domain-containing protein [Haloferacaceae archaeon DSL9]
MSLPFDPETVSGDHIGEKRTTLEMDHEAAIERVRAVCEDVGFGVPAEFSPSELLNEKVDAGRDPYYVLGACNPSMADRGLDATENRLGALFPCNMVVWEEEPGVQTVYHVSIMKLARLMGIVADDAEMESIIDETGAMVEEVFAQLDDA